MSQDKIRILKLLVYEGPRDVVEEHVSNTIFGTKKLNFKGNPEKVYSITGISLITFPDILETLPENEIEQK